jgi:hypothetical protein
MFQRARHHQKRPRRRRPAVGPRVAALLIAGCAPLVDMPAPTPGGPHISTLRVAPAPGQAGCPVSLAFRVDRALATVVRARAGWTHTRGRRQDGGAALVPVDAVTDQLPAEINVQLVPQQPGTYRYRVQAEDEAGRRSNVLTEQLSVPGLWAPPSPCPTPAAAGQGAS